MHGELFKSRCDTCSRPPFHDTNTYDPPAEPGCECFGRIRPHICWFGEMPFELDRIFLALDECRSSLLWARPAWSSQRRASSPHVGGTRGACERIFFHGMPFGKAGEVLPDILDRN